MTVNTTIVGAWTRHNEDGGWSVGLTLGDERKIEVRRFALDEIRFDPATSRAITPGEYCDQLMNAILGRDS